MTAASKSNRRPWRTSPRLTKWRVRERDWETAALPIDLFFWSYSLFSVTHRHPSSSSPAFFNDDGHVYPGETEKLVPIWGERRRRDDALQQSRMERHDSWKLEQQKEATQRGEPDRYVYCQRLSSPIAPINWRKKKSRSGIMQVKFALSCVPLQTRKNAPCLGQDT